MNDLQKKFCKDYIDKSKLHPKDNTNNLELFEEADLQVKNILSTFLVDMGDAPNKEEFQYSQHIIEESIDKLKEKKQKIQNDINKKKLFSKTRIHSSSELSSLGFLFNKKKHPRKISSDTNDKITKDSHSDEFVIQRVKSFHKIKLKHNEIFDELDNNQKFQGFIEATRSERKFNDIENNNLNKELQINKLSLINDNKYLSTHIHDKKTHIMFPFNSHVNQLKKSQNCNNISSLSSDMLDSYNDICMKMKQSLFPPINQDTDKRHDILPNEHKLQNIHNIVREEGIHSPKIIDEENNLILSSPNQENSNNSHEGKYRILRHPTQQVYDSLSDSEEEIFNEINDELLIKPKSFIKIIIDLLIILSTFFILIFTPLELAFSYDYINYPLQLLILNFLSEIIFVCDFIFGFFTIYHDYHDIEPISNISNRISYLQGRFFLDLLEAIPFSSIIYTYIKINPNSNLSLQTKLYFHFAKIKYIHLFKLIKLIKVMKVSVRNEITSYLSDKAIHSKLGRSLLLYITIIAFLFLVHLLSCYYIFIGYNNYPNWIVSQNLTPTNHIKIYVASLYFLCLTILGIGYGDICPSNIEETCFTIFLLLIAVFIFSWLVSAISKLKDVDIIIMDDSQVIECQKRLEILKEIHTGYKNMDLTIYNKIERYLKCSLLKEQYNPNIILNYLPSNLKKDLIVAMYKPIIDNFVFFKYFNNQEFAMKIVLCFKPNLFLKNERIVDCGDFIQEMFFILKGKLSLEIPLLSDFSTTNIQAIDKVILSFNKIHKSLTFSKDPSVKEINEIKQNYVKLLELRTNEHYGDLMMFMNERSHLSVRVSSKTAMVYYLNQTDAVNVSLQFPNIWKKIIINSIKNMKVINKLVEKALTLFYQHNNKNVLKVLLEKNELYLKQLEKTEKKMQSHNSMKETKIIANYGTKSLEESERNETHKSIIYSESSTNRRLLSNNNRTKINNQQEENLSFDLENTKHNLFNDSCNVSKETSQDFEENCDDSKLSLNNGIKKKGSTTYINKSNKIDLNIQQIDKIFEKTPQKKSLFNNNYNHFSSEVPDSFSSFALRYTQNTQNIPENLPEASPITYVSEISENNNNLTSDSISVNNELSTRENLFPFHLSNNSYHFNNNIQDAVARRLSEQNVFKDNKILMLPSFSETDLNSPSPNSNSKTRKTCFNIQSVISKKNSKHIPRTPKAKNSFDLYKSNKFKYAPSSQLIRPLKLGMLEPVGTKVDSFGQISKELKLINFETGIQALDTAIKITAPQRANTPKNNNNAIKKRRISVFHKESSKKLNMIESNIEKSCLNLNDPKEFYSKKFKKMIHNNKRRKTIDVGNICASNLIVNKFNS